MRDPTPSAAPPGARLLSLADPEYPELLREIHDPPERLWILGGFVPEDRDAVAVVGSRRASPYGTAVAERLGRELAAAGITVVSGLAIGVDGAAHRGALAAGGRTIAVLGSGLDDVYPRRHRRLAEEVAASGAVVTELDLGAPPIDFHFPKRNRIVAGLARAVVIVEAGERSGSLITARLAGEEGRDVYAVPGEVCLDRTRGVHRLLKEGAGLVEKAEDVLAGTFTDRLESGRKTGQRGRLRGARDGALGEILSIFDGLDETVVPMDELIEKSGLPVAEALEALATLELDGEVTRHPGPGYSRTRS